MEGKLKLSVIVPKIMNDLSIEIQARGLSLYRIPITAGGAPGKPFYSGYVPNLMCH